MRGDRAGFALLFAVFLVMALAVSALGVLAVAVRESAVAGAAVGKARAERGAEAAALHAVETWSTRAVADLAIGGARQLAAPGDADVVVERVDSGLFLLRGTGQAPGRHGPATARAGLLVRVLHPDRLRALLPAALVADSGTVAGGTVDGVDSCAAPVPGVVAAVASIGPGSTVTGDPPVELGPRPASVPDPFHPELARDLATVRYSDPTAEPRPVGVGECVADRLNWGSPDPGHPCHGLRPLIIASDLTVTGGSGHGVLVVNGDLTITGARFDGVVAVAGHLLVDGGSVIRGAVRAASAVIRDGMVVRDGCVLGRVLSAPALDRAFRPPSRWWFPVF